MSIFESCIYTKINIGYPKNMTLQKLYSYTRQAINDFQLTQEGDKIAIGLSVPFQDAVLAYLSIKYDCKILTLDKHFPMMKVLDDRIGLWEVC